jgi:nucleoside-diphosphate-sugar epimerase
MASNQLIKSAVVVGGCGSLGHKLVRALLELTPAPQVSVFDLRTTQNRYPSVEYYDVDISNKDEVYTALRKAHPQVVFHTASPPPSLLDLDLYMKVNVEGTRNLLDGAKVRTQPHLAFDLLTDGFAGARYRGICIHIKCIRRP